MGNTGIHSEFSPEASHRVEDRIGKLQLQGRYHLLPQKLSDSYDLTDKVLGSGYNGAVWMAVGKGPNAQKFAVKEFNLESIPKHKRSQLESEIEVFLSMDHPHIARLIDVYETAGKLQLVMECMEGGELFDRVTELKRFSESDAAEATCQMLLAINYIHSHGIVHRDIKLENFLYEKKKGSYLKLIDFGFSKVWDPNVHMKVSCGTLGYVAPEVLQKSYTSQCDLWSLGVLVFILLSGYMPFAGSEANQTKNIAAGKFKFKKERWDSVSTLGINFVQSLMQVDPSVRLTAEQALQHDWITTRRSRSDTEIDTGIVDALRSFGHASKFRRCCLEMMAWSLSAEERAKIRQTFMAIDTSNQGTITLAELRRVLVDRFKIKDAEALKIFNALDSQGDDEIHYSNFLAAVMNTRIGLHDGLLSSAFSKFDADSSGYITVDNLKHILGDTHDGEDVATLLKEADLLQDGRISYQEFVAYIRESPLENTNRRLDSAESTSMIIDRETPANRSKVLNRQASRSSLFSQQPPPRTLTACCPVL